MRLVSPSLSASRRGPRCCFSWITRFWSFRACHFSWGRRIFLVSCSNSFSKCWLVARRASTSSVLACTVSNSPPRGRLSTPLGWSCILGGLALLQLVFRVDTISRLEVIFICKGNVVPTDGAKLMILFQLELGLSMLDLLGRSADSVHWTPLQKQETKRIGGGSPVASPMPKSVLSGARED